MNFSTTRGQHVGARIIEVSAHDEYGARVFPRLVRSRLVRDSNLRCPQFQCKSVHGAPLCLSNGTMNPQKKLGTWNFVPVLSLKERSRHNGRSAEGIGVTPIRGRPIIDTGRKRRWLERRGGGRKRRREACTRSQTVVSDSVTRLITRLERGPRFNRLV